MRYDIRLVVAASVAAVLFVPSVALADAGTYVPGYVVEFGLVLLTPLLTALGAWLAAEAIRWLRANVSHTQSREALERAVHAVGTAVSATSQTAVAALKRASSDGKLTLEEALVVRDLALEEAKSYLGPRGLAKIREVIGTDDDALDRYLIGLIEARVGETFTFGETSEVEK